MFDEGRYERFTPVLLLDEGDDRVAALFCSEESVGLGKRLLDGWCLLFVPHGLNLLTLTFLIDCAFRERGHRTGSGSGFYGVVIFGSVLSEYFGRKGVEDMSSSARGAAVPPSAEKIMRLPVENVIAIASTLDLDNYTDIEILKAIASKLGNESTRLKEAGLKKFITTRLNSFLVAKTEALRTEALSAAAGNSAAASSAPEGNGGRKVVAAKRTYTRKDIEDMDNFDELQDIARDLKVENFGLIETEEELKEAIIAEIAARDAAAAIQNRGTVTVAENSVIASSAARKQSTSAAPAPVAATATQSRKPPAPSTLTALWGQSAPAPVPVQQAPAQEEQAQAKVRGRKKAVAAAAPEPKSGQNSSAGSGNSASLGSGNSASLGSGNSASASSMVDEEITASEQQRRNATEIFDPHGTIFGAAGAPSIYGQEDMGELGPVTFGQESKEGLGPVTFGQESKEGLGSEDPETRRERQRAAIAGFERGMNVRAQEERLRLTAAAAAEPYITPRERFFNSLRQWYETIFADFSSDEAFNMEELYSAIALKINTVINTGVEGNTDGQNVTNLMVCVFAEFAALMNRLLIHNRMVDIQFNGAFGTFNQLINETTGDDNTERIFRWQRIIHSPYNYSVLIRQDDSISVNAELTRFASFNAPDVNSFFKFLLFYLFVAKNKTVGTPNAALDAYRVGVGYTYRIFLQQGEPYVIDILSGRTTTSGGRRRRQTRHRGNRSLRQKGRRHRTTKRSGIKLRRTRKRHPLKI